MKEPTSGGVELTHELLDRLAEEAERGYDVAQVRPRTARRGAAMNRPLHHMMWSHTVLSHPDHGELMIAARRRPWSWLLGPRVRWFRRPAPDARRYQPWQEVQSWYDLPGPDGRWAP